MATCLRWNDPFDTVFWDVFHNVDIIYIYIYIYIIYIYTHYIYIYTYILYIYIMLHNVGSCCTLATEGLYTCAALVSHTVCSSSKYNLADGTQSKESNTLVPTPNTNWGGLGVFHSIALAFQTFLAHQATKGKVGYISEVASENTRIQRSEFWTWPKKPNNYRHSRSGNLRSNTLTAKAWKLTNWRL